MSSFSDLTPPFSRNLIQAKILILLSSALHVITKFIDSGADDSITKENDSWESA